MSSTVGKQSRRLPQLTNAGLDATASVISYNEYNEAVDGSVAVERALTIYLDKREVVTLMTLGNHPELLILGWLYNQRAVYDCKFFSQSAFGSSRFWKDLLGQNAGPSRH